MIYIELIIEFLKIGFFAIGGYGTIALISDEMINKGWLNEEQISNIIAIAESTPGPIAVNLATYVGSMKAGIFGSIVATMAEVFPAFIIILLCSFVMDSLVNNKIYNKAFLIIRPAVNGVILSTGIIFIFQNALGIVNLEKIEINVKGIVIFVMMLGIMIVYKKVCKKSIGTIFLIIIPAILGILINMV